jgi:hypothetical protein
VAAKGSRHDLPKYHALEQKRTTTRASDRHTGAMVAIVDDEANNLFQAASPKVQAKIVSEIAKLVSKRCVPRRTRVWAVWPSGNNVHDGLRVVDALRDADLVMHGTSGRCKIPSLHICLRLSPQPQNALDARFSMVCQSVMHRMVERSGGALELHTKTQSLQNTRFSRGFGVCFSDRNLLLKALDDIEQLLHEKLSASPPQQFSPSSTSESS